MKFDPHRYVLAAGWDFNSVEATARLGVAPRDVEVIMEMMGADAAAEPIAELMEWCKRRVAENPWANRG